MTYSIRILFFFFALVTFSSCAVVNEVHFNKNYSGTFTTTLDYSGIYDMMESFGAGDEADDMSISGQFDADQQAKLIEVMNSADGISNASISVLEDEQSMGISFDFEDIEKMEEAFAYYQEKMIEEGPEEARDLGISPDAGLGMLTQFSREGKVISYNGSVPSDMLDNLGSEMEMDINPADAFGLMGEMFDYTLVMSFDKKIKEVSVEGIDILSQEKKMVKGRIDLAKMMQGEPVSIDVKVK